MSSLATPPSRRQPTVLQKIPSKTPLSSYLEWALIAAFLAVVVALFLRALPLGIDSAGIVRYWNNDDANIRSYYAAIYKRIVLPPVDHIGYPFFYYYISGILVVPMALFLGPEPQTVSLAWRLMNLGFFLGTNVLLAHICRRYLRTRWAGLAAVVLYSAMQVICVPLLKFKPPTCEAFLNLLILVGCFRMLESFRLKEWA